MPKNPSAERRASTRFPLILDVRYAVWDRRAPVETGSGRTIDLSSAGLKFTADMPLRTGEKLDVFVDWPVLLDGGVQLQLIMSGIVVRTNGTATALQIPPARIQNAPCGTKGCAASGVGRLKRSHNLACISRGSNHLAGFGVPLHAAALFQ